MRKIHKSTVLLLVFLIMIASLSVKPVYANTNQWMVPATVTKVTSSTLETLIDPRADGSTEMSERINGVTRTYTPQRETYHPDDRQWQGLPSIVRTGDRLWAAWYSGGTGEPRQFNYVIIAYSDDNGASWVDPFIILDHQDPDHDGVSLVVPNLFVDHEGNLALIWIQYHTWILRFHDADADDIDTVTWDEPEMYTSSKIHKPPTPFVDSDGTEGLILGSEAEVGDAHIGVTRFYVSKDHGESWSLRSSLPSSSANNRLFPESHIAQLSDGTLMVMSRLEKGSAGGIERATSSDHGHTWTPYENNLDQPFIGPGSKPHIMTLSSGNLLIINHNTTSSRAGLVAYLSTDNGATFPYTLPIDLRQDVTYPYAYEKDGLIHVTWDKGRFLEKEIRLAMFTEDDVKAGAYTSASSVELGIISKLNETYKEIISINDAFSNTLRFPVGTPSETIRQGLPGSITVTDNHGETYVLSGTWKNPGYYENVAGTYRFYFDTSLPLNVSDTYDMLSVEVELYVQPDEGLGILVWVLPLVGVSLGAGYVVFRIKKSKRQGTIQ
jgi:hypothetical protein